MFGEGRDDAEKVALSRASSSRRLLLALAGLAEPPLRCRQKLVLRPYPVLKQAHQQHCELIRMRIVLRHDLRENAFEQGKIIGAEMNVGRNTATHDHTLRSADHLGKSVW